MNLLLSQMSVEELREEACDCLFEIINKGMDPVDKTKLVESLCQVLQSAGFFNVEQVRLFLIFSLVALTLLQVVCRSVRYQRFTLIRPH